MTTKQNILNTLRQNTRETYDMPDFTELSPIIYPDPIAEFKNKAQSVAGAKLIEVATGFDINEVVRSAYPDAQVIAGHIPGLQADLDPDTVAHAQELAKADVGVIAGDIGVAENACIWIPQTMKERAICFASQQLVILLRANSIVNNMHEAYQRISQHTEYFSQYKFGTFISGPSKTADIEGALVYGAQAARAVTIVLIS